MIGRMDRICWRIKAGQRSGWEGSKGALFAPLSAMSAPFLSPPLMSCHAPSVFATLHPAPVSPKTPGRQTPQQQLPVGHENRGLRLPPGRTSGRAVVFHAGQGGAIVLWFSARHRVLCVFGVSPFTMPVFVWRGRRGGRFWAAYSPSLLLLHRARGDFRLNRSLSL